MDTQCTKSVWTTDCTSRYIKLDVESMMQYYYKAAWTISGGINLPKDSQPIELYRSEQCRFVLTNSPDILLVDVDRGAAVGRLMLKGFAGHTDFAVAVKAEIDEIKAERAKSIGTQTTLIIEANGEIDATINRAFKEHKDFIVTFDAVNKQAVAQMHQSEIQAMKLAVALENDAPSRFAALAEGTYLTNEAGKIVYSINFTMSCDMSLSRGISTDSADRISERYAMLQTMSDLKSVGRLFSQMSDYGTDRRKVFLSGWAALERLIEKAFKSHKHKVDQSIKQRFVTYSKDVENGNYKPADKFLAVASVLFPDDFEGDIKQFSILKELRDSISHGHEVTESTLPIHKLDKLLRKYILAHISMQSQSSYSQLLDN